MHIPKTAGTSFRLVLAPLFRWWRIFPGRIDLFRNRGHYPPPVHALRMCENRRGRIDFVFGHYPFFFAERTGIRNVCVFLRRPVERAVSNLLHLQRHGLNVSLDRILDYPAVIPKELDNRQTRFFLQGTDDRPFEYLLEGAEITEECFRVALENLERCRFIGITEEYEESVRLAAWTFRLPALPSSHENRTPSSAYRQVTREIVSRLERVNEWDQRLYRRALELYHQRKEEMRASPAIPTASGHRFSLGSARSDTTASSAERRSRGSAGDA